MAALKPSFSLTSRAARANYYMNELGIALICPNIRGSSGYGKEYLKLDNGYLREQILIKISVHF